MDYFPLIINSVDKPSIGHSVAERSRLLFGELGFFFSNMPVSLTEKFSYQLFRCFSNSVSLYCVRYCLHLVGRFLLLSSEGFNSLPLKMASTKDGRKSTANFASLSESL